MKLFFLALLLLTASVCQAAIQADKNVPRLHSIFDGALRPVAAAPAFDAHLLAAQELRFSDPHTLVHRKTQPPGHGLAIAGGAFMGFGVGGYVGSRLFAAEQQPGQPDNAASILLAAFCLFAAALGLLLFLIGTIIAGAHRPHVTTVQDPRF